MGMDGVEIVMAVEDAFDIQIEDADAEILRTPRQLIDLVQCKVSVATASVCLTHRAFNLLRKSFLQHGWKRSEITPSAQLAGLVASDQRRTLIGKLTSEWGIKRPPELLRSRWLNFAVLLGSLLAGLAAAYFIVHEMGSPAICVFMAVAIVSAGIALRLTRPLCKEFPPNLKTAGDLAQWITTHKPDLANPAAHAWTPDQITARIREIVVDVLGCKPDFSEDADFVKDLGLS